MTGPLARSVPSVVAMIFAASLAACAADPRYPIEAGQPAGTGLQPLSPAYPVRDAPGGLAAPTPSPSVAPPPTGSPAPSSMDDSAAYPPSAAGSVDQTPLPPPPPTTSGAAPSAVDGAGPLPPPAVAHVLRRRPGTLSYVVAKHDTLYGVGRRFGLTPASLARANGLDLDKTLQPGARLKLPFTAKDGGEASHALGAAERTPGRTFEVAVPSPPHPRPAPSATAAPPPPGLVPPASTSLSAAPHAEARAGEGPPSSPIPYSQLVSGRRARPRRGRTAADAVAAASGAVAPMRLDASQPPAALPVEAPAPDAQAVTQAARGRFIRPVVGAVLSSFGVKGPGQRNDGVDLAAHEGESVRAAAAGVVVYAGHDVPALGNLVAVKHADGWVTVYGNLETITVRPAEHVGQGAQIGVAGPTSATPHSQVHFEVRYAANPSDKARPVDPDLVLPKAG